MTCEVRNKEINSQCAKLLVRPLYIRFSKLKIYNVNETSFLLRKSIFSFKTLIFTRCGELQFDDNHNNN